MRFRELTTESTGLSPATLASYKKKAGAEASALDKEAWEKGGPDAQKKISKANKRFSGVVRATKKEFDNDAKGVTEGTSSIGKAIKSLYRKIYIAGDDEIDYFYNDSPIFAHYWDEYEGDLDSIIAEVDPSELQIIYDELKSYAEQANIKESIDSELEQLTGNYRALMIGDMLDAEGKRKVTMVYNLLRDPIMQGDREEYEKMHGYVGGKYPDIFDLLVGADDYVKGVNEMDSQGYTGSRDRKSTSKYGSRDDYDLGHGKEGKAKLLTAKQMMDRAHKAMMKSMSNDEKNDKGWRNPNLKESNTIDFIRGLISEFNTQMSGSPYYPLDYKNPGMRMWTRGDGSKYKDPGYIFIERDLKPEDQPKWHKAKAVEKFWKFLESKGARKIGDVSGEFGSDPHSPAVVLNKQVFVFDGRSIAWGSTSRLKNSSVWRQKQQGVAESQDERSQMRLWAMITDYEKRAKATKNDIKRDHYMKMAQQLRDKLKTSEVNESPETVAFEVDSENAYNHIMHRYGSRISWDGDAMVIPAKYWNEVQELALSAGGNAVEYGTTNEASLATMRDYFAGDENAEDELKITQQRKHYANDHGKQQPPKFNSLASYHQWLKRVGAEQINKR